MLISTLLEHIRDLLYTSPARASRFLELCEVLRVYETLSSDDQSLVSAYLGEHIGALGSPWREPSLRPPPLSWQVAYRDPNESDPPLWNLTSPWDVVLFNTGPRFNLVSRLVSRAQPSDQPKRIAIPLHPTAWDAPKHVLHAVALNEARTLCDAVHEHGGQARCVSTTTHNPSAWASSEESFHRMPWFGVFFATHPVTTEALRGIQECLSAVSCAVDVDPTRADSMYRRIVGVGMTLAEAQRWASQCEVYNVRAHPVLLGPHGALLLHTGDGSHYV